VGKFSEFDQLRKIGVRFADMKGYQYSRDDVRGRALANAYSQAIGDVFTRELKPLEVEVIVAEVGDPGLVGHEESEIYRIAFDGSISDHSGYCVIGGSEEELLSHLQSNYTANAPLGDVLRLGRAALGRATDGSSMAPDQLEVCVLEKARIGRKFRRLDTDELRQHLGG
jgi:proteasome alpha subunit